MIGTQLGGRYEILERIGGGGMALVYKGLDILLHRKVAVKVLRQQYVHDEEFIRRFRREAQSAASLSHPNVVSIYDVGQEGEIHYIVMEYIEGTTLNELIKERAPLQVEEAVHFACQIGDALEHAHQNQIIHRDIKPHNILIGKNGRVKVTDFGIARAATSSTITQTGSVVGSVHYFSPEHAKGTPTGEQSDLYSLGIVLYQMLTGRLPFLGESPISVALKHLQEDVEEPRKVNPLIPQSVENIILRAMRKNPAERYQTARQMLDDLDTALRPDRRNEPKISFHDNVYDEEQTRVIPAIRADQYQESSDGPVEDEGAEPAPVKKRRWVKPTVWAVILIALMIGAWYLVGLAKSINVMPPDVPVPNVVNMPIDKAKDELAKAQLVPDIILEANDKVAKDTVISQSPSNMKVKANSKVVLHVSSGTEKQKMPPLTGSKLADAKLALINLGIKEDRITTDPKFLDDPPDTIVQQTPTAGEEIDPATAVVKLTISKGRESFPMPNLVGLTIEEAKNKITVSKLKLASEGISYETSYKQPKGKVIKQFPYEFKDDVSAGAEIKLVVSSGLPEDAGQMTVSVPVKPAKEGKTSEIKLILTDAQYDNLEYKTVTVSKPENIDVKLVVAPDKNAVIQVKQDGTIINIITTTYQDYLAAKSGKPAGNNQTPPAQGTGNGTNNGAAGGQTGKPNTGGTGTTPGTNGGATPGGTGTTPGTNGGTAPNGGTTTPPPSQIGPGASGTNGTGTPQQGATPAAGQGGTSTQTTGGRN
ncbi:Stk1 family PASTA domain-containing Ser/Thr kinase [Paenibacillus thalictri]|uniref:Serine/threonine-protein kinase PrkC n=1 Tax=Paenibacillus thalictri TaxID=2527873 RepID=A0A4V2J480_9BACL|nr:Stk1 family PASTA domain-containing Ser/Thr kinase [Paenibacillus thalictri]TBL78338.1 Stk1 family PASTA domain-containing Ser/Thr kinase [Paenibacillus thalictri]